MSVKLRCDVYVIAWLLNGMIGKCDSSSRVSRTGVYRDRR
jgi:hypothetical protein